MVVGARTDFFNSLNLYRGISSMLSQFSRFLMHWNLFSFTGFEYFQIPALSIYTIGLDRSKQGTKNKPWFTRSEYVFLITFAFTFIYFEYFQILTKIHYFPHSLYKILKGSKISQWSIPPNISLFPLTCFGVSKPSV